MGSGIIDPIIDPQRCPGAEPVACAVDGHGAACSTGKCLGQVCVREITGKVGFQYWRPNGTTVFVAPGDGFSVTAHADEPGWGFRWDTSAAVDPSTGNYRAHVPLGTATVLVWDGEGVARGSVTAAATQDFLWDVAGRADETIAPAGATVYFNASGLQAWTASTDEFALSTSGGYVGSLTAPYNQGHTSIQFPFALDGWPLHAPAFGDWAFVFQRANRTWSTWNYLAAVKVAALSTTQYTFTGVSPQVIPISLGNPTNATVSFDWRFTDMTQYLSALGPGVSAYDFTGTVGVHPYTTAAEVMPPSEVLRMRVPSGFSNAVVGPLTYGRLPVPSATDVTSVEMTAYVPKFLAGTTSATTAYAFVLREAAVTATVATTPTLGPVRFVQYEDGGSAFTPRSGVGTTPLLKWTAPAIGTPTGYVVRVARLDNVGGATRGSFISAIATTATSLRLPPGLLEAGKTYFASIDARQGTGNLVAAPLRKLGWPRASSRVVTADFSP
jgi:hypothetical protein